MGQGANVVLTALAEGSYVVAEKSTCSIKWVWARVGLRTVLVLSAGRQCTEMRLVGNGIEPKDCYRVDYDCAIQLL